MNRLHKLRKTRFALSLVCLLYTSAREFFNGTSDNAFTPSGTMTRAMLVTVLHRMDGEPDAAKASFPDVAEGKWFSKAVAWASANGIASGYANGNFGPNDPITREQLAVIFYQYANYLKMETCLLYTSRCV